MTPGSEIEVWQPPRHSERLCATWDSNTAMRVCACKCVSCRIPQTPFCRCLKCRLHMTMGVYRPVVDVPLPPYEED